MNTSAEQRNAMVSLAIKKLLYSFQLVGPIMEIMFEYRGKVKQDRLIRFAELLEAELLKNEIDLEKIHTEEASDLFESIFRKVAETRSEQKRVAFKNLLLRGMGSEKDIDHCELFSDLLLNISEKELEIMWYHKKFLIEDTGALVMRNALKNELDQLNDRKVRLGSLYKLSQKINPKPVDQLSKQYSEAKELVKFYEAECKAENFGLTEYEYRYFLQSLFGKGLLSDDGAGAIGTNAFEIMSLTKFGIKFLSFIESDEKH